MDAVSNNTIECGHTVSYYYYGKDPAYCFDSAVPWDDERAPDECLDVRRRRHEADPRNVQAAEDRQLPDGQ